MQSVDTKNYWCSAYSRLHCADFTVDSREKLFFTRALVEMSELLLQQYICWGWAELSVQPLSVSWFTTWSTNVARISSDKFGFRHLCPRPPPGLSLPLPLPLPTPLPPRALPLILTLPLPLTATLPPIFVEDRYTHLLPFYNACAWLVNLQLSTQVSVYLTWSSGS